MPWHRTPRIEGAMAGLDAAQAYVQSFKSNMQAQLRLRYHDLVRRIAEYSVAREDVKLMEGMYKRIEIQVATGEKARFELVKANAELLNAQKMQESAGLRVGQSKGALRALVGKQLPANFDVQESPHFFDKPPDLRDIRDRVLLLSPELQRTRAERLQIERKLTEEKALRLLGTHLVDADIGTYFFNNAQRMHRDLLSDAAEAIIGKKIKSKEIVPLQ